MARHGMWRGGGSFFNIAKKAVPLSPFETFHSLPLQLIDLIPLEKLARKADISFRWGNNSYTSGILTLKTLRSDLRLQSVQLPVNPRNTNFIYNETIQIYDIFQSLFPFSYFGRPSFCTQRMMILFHMSKVFFSFINFIYKSEKNGEGKFIC